MEGAFPVHYPMDAGGKRASLSWDNLVQMHERGLALRHVSTTEELTNELARGVIYGDAISLAPSTRYLKAVLADKENVPPDLQFVAQLLGDNLGALFQMKLAPQVQKWLVQRFSTDIQSWLAGVEGGPLSVLEVGARAQQAYDVKREYPTGKIGRSEKHDAIRAVLVPSDNTKVSVRWNTLVRALRDLCETRSRLFDPLKGVVA